MARKQNKINHLDRLDTIQVARLIEVLDRATRHESRVYVRQPGTGLIAVYKDSRTYYRVTYMGLAGTVVEAVVHSSDRGGLFVRSLSTEDKGWGAAREEK